MASTLYDSVPILGKKKKRRLWRSLECKSRDASHERRGYLVTGSSEKVAKREAQFSAEFGFSSESLRKDERKGDDGMRILQFSEKGGDITSSGHTQSKTRTRKLTALAYFHEQSNFEGRILASDKAFVQLPRLLCCLALSLKSPMSKAFGSPECVIASQGHRTKSDRATTPYCQEVKSWLEWCSLPPISPWPPKFKFY